MEWVNNNNSNLSSGKFHYITVVFRKVLGDLARDLGTPLEDDLNKGNSLINRTTEMLTFKS